MDYREALEKKAAGKSVDPHHLLQGEDPSTDQPDDARHWARVYEELLSFKQRLLAMTQETLERMQSEAARDEVLSTDEAILEAEARRFEHRLSFWRERLRILEARRTPNAGGSG